MKRFFQDYACVAAIVIGCAVTMLAFLWCAATMHHHPNFCTEETAAVAATRLHCETKGQKLEFMEKRDRTWAVCRCP